MTPPPGVEHGALRGGHELDRGADLVHVALHGRAIGLVLVVRRAGIEAALELDVLRQVHDHRARAPFAAT
jgi:hypothetical protein